jgi:hypothetical protein
VTRVLIWKEVREQRAAWLTLVLTAAGAVAALNARVSPGDRHDEMLSAVLWFAAWGYGLVCGALLLAGEAEDDTQAFLDTLPAARRRLWRVKAGVGLLLLAAQVAVLALVDAALSRGRSAPGRIAGDVAGLAFCGGVGYAWGLLCGTSAANVLGAVARAVLWQGLWGLVLFPFVVIPLDALAFHDTPGALLALSASAVGLVAAGAGVRSRAVYCRPDRLRESAGDPRRRGPAHRPGVAFRIALRHVRRFAIAMAVVGVAGALAVVGAGVMAWPPVTLLIGVLCGVTTFAGTRRSRASRTTLRRRALAGRVRLWTAALRLAAGVGAAALTALPVLALLGMKLGSGRYDEWPRLREHLLVSSASGLVTEPCVFLSLWFTYGYAAGLFFGRACRGEIAAGVAAVAAAGVFAAMWAPSVFFVGPVHIWQVAGVPAVLTAAAFLPFKRCTAGVIAGALLAAGLWQAGALWYRVGEIPRDPYAIDLEAYKASLPTPEENPGGRRMAAALRRLRVVEITFREDLPDLLPAPGRAARPRVDFFTYLSQLHDTAERGWEARDGRLGAFLDRVFQDPWARELAEAADLPTGVLVDPRELNAGSPLPDAQTATTLLVARGLQRQAEGDPSVFVENLRTGLALARNLRHRTVLIAGHISFHIDQQLAHGVGRWLERLDGRPDLLRRTLAALREHLAEPPPELEEFWKAELVVLANTRADPGSLQRRGNGSDPFFPWGLNDAALLRLSWQAPWERARFGRLLDEFASRDAERERRALELAAHLEKSIVPSFPHMFRHKFPTPWLACQAPAAELQVALRLYREEIGRPAERLDELVPRYLAAVPADPYDGQPFRYRLSGGETLDWPPASFTNQGPTLVKKEVRPDQGILWCVGSDGRDDGGHAQEHLPPGGGELTGDVIFLVPLPPARR